MTYAELQRNRILSEISSALRRMQTSMTSGIWHSNNIVSNLALFSQIEELLEEGFDLSSLYPDMILISASTSMRNIDIVNLLRIKTVIYRFLAKYSVERQDLVLLFVNTMRTDIMSTEASLRRLVLNAVSNVKWDYSNAHYAFELSLIGTRDSQRMVQCEGLNAFIKISRKLPNVFEAYSDSMRKATEYLILNSKDLTVLLNSIATLYEISMEYLEDFAISKLVASRLLLLTNSAESLPVPGIVATLKLLTRFHPGSQEESITIMVSFILICNNSIRTIYFMILGVE